MGLSGRLANSHQYDIFLKLAMVQPPNIELLLSQIETLFSEVLYSFASQWRRDHRMAFHSEHSKCSVVRGWMGLGSDSFKLTEKII